MQARAWQFSSLTDSSLSSAASGKVSKPKGKALLCQNQNSTKGKNDASEEETELEKKAFLK